MLYGDNENEPKFENIERLCIDVLEAELIPLLLRHMKDLEFEARKDATLLINYIVKRAQNNSALDYLQNRPEILKTLVEGYNDSDIALNFGLILRECIQHHCLCEIVLNSEFFFSFFDFIESPSFDVASDAYVSMKCILTEHTNLVFEFLEKNYDSFFQKCAVLLKSKNYVTLRQSLKLLCDILLEKKNFSIMVRYINEVDHLKTLMVLLKHKSKNIQFEAFHLFKLFVANPHKPKEILDILMRNKTRLMEFLQGFQNEKDKTDAHFKDDKKLLISALSRLESHEDTRVETN